MNSGRPPLNLPDLSHLNPSNLKVICRIRPPKTYEQSREQKKMTSSLINSPSNKTYTCVRNKSRSISKEVASPYRNSAALRQTLRNSSGKRSTSRSNSRGRSSANKTSSFVGQQNGMVNPEKKYCIFTTKERSNVVLACENPVPGKLINESLVDQQDLKYFNNSVLAQNQSFTFNFDSVYNESIKQEKFYSSSVRPLIKSFVEGENACVLLFGPTEGGKTYTLKGKTGMERGILPRAVEDMFNIVRNSEEREEDFELITPDITESESDVIPHQDMYRGSSYPMNQSNPRDQLRRERVPERMFLKVCVYQIYVDKVLDLLSANTVKQRVQIDHYIDKNSDEVVSKLSNITEKVVFTLEDFYSVLQEAFKNRRIESVNMQEQELRKKSHFIIGLTLMKRQANKKMVEISHINFVELSGSEQAVAEEKFYQDASVKNFVTKSFNSLSSQLLRASLKKKNHGLDEGDSKIVNSLRNTLTSTSNILVVCCVNPGAQYYDHSLPAVKFCARIRDYIMRKARHHGGQKSFNNSTLDNIDYNNETDRGGHHTGGDRQITRDLIDHIRNEVTQKSLSMNSGEFIDKQELERWRLDKIDIVERNIQRLRNQSYHSKGAHDKDYQPMIEDLIYIKDRLQNIQQQNNQGYSLGNTQRSQTYNPYTSQSHHQASMDFKLQPTNSYDHIYKQDSLERPLERQRHSRERLEAFDLARAEHPETPQFDYGMSERNYDQQLNKSNSRRQLQPVIRNQSNVFSPQSAPNKSSFQSKQGGFTQQYQTFQRENIQPNRNNFDIEQSLDAGQMFQGNQSLSRNPGAIKIYNTQEEQNTNILSPKMNLNESRSISKQLSRINQNQTTNVLGGENEFLNRVHPQLDVSLTGEPNNIMGSLPPSRSPSPQKIVMFRPTGNSSRQQNYSKGNIGAKGSGNNTSQVSQKQHQSIIDLQNKSQRIGSHRQSLLNVSNKLSQLQNESVYENEYDCMNDINRLIKMNDQEGIKKRIMQIYKEKLEQENLLKSIDQNLGNLKEELEVKDQLIQEYDKIVQQTTDDHQLVVENLVSENQETEQKFNLKEATFRKTINTFQEKLKEIQDERDRFEKEHELMQIENKTYERVKNEAEDKLNKLVSENEKLKQNYEILKEHEISLIRDFEGKKQKEIGFQDDQISILKQQVKDEQAKIKDYESQIFSLKEDFRRAEFDNEKNGEDRRHMAQQIEKLGTQLEKEEEQRQEMMKTLEENAKSYEQVQIGKEKVEEERNKAFSEIDKLHALIEEMEQTIQREQQKRGEERQAKEDKIQEMVELSKQLSLLKEQLQAKEEEMQLHKYQFLYRSQFEPKEQELMSQIRELLTKIEEQDKQLIMIKAKEYDKVDLLKKLAELESKMKFLQVDNETLVKERNNLDIANVEMNREKVDLEQHCLSLENEVEFFRKTHEEHLDKFDQKMEIISTQLSQLKNENIILKEKEKNLRKVAREIEEERDEWREKTKINERRCHDLGDRMNDMEKEIVAMMQEKEKEMRDQVMRQNMEVKVKEEEKGKMLEDIQHLIKSFKEEKKSQKTHIPAINSIHHSSGYY